MRTSAVDPYPELHASKSQNASHLGDDPGTRGTKPRAIVFFSASFLCTNKIQNC